MHFKDIIILIRVDIMCLSTLTADASPQTLTSGVIIYAMSGNSVLLEKGRFCSGTCLKS